MLGYTGEEFRRMTYAEFTLAFDGYLESKGVKKDKDKMMSRKEFLDLADMFEGDS